MGAENLALTGIRFPDRPARSESLYWLRSIRRLTEKHKYFMRKFSHLPSCIFSSGLRVCRAPKFLFTCGSQTSWCVSNFQIALYSWFFNCFARNKLFLFCCPSAQFTVKMAATNNCLWTANRMSWLSSVHYSVTVWMMFTAACMAFSSVSYILFSSGSNICCWSQS